jgi:hypothetical protein
MRLAKSTSVFYAAPQPNVQGDDAETFTQLVEELNSKFNSSSQQALTADAVQARYRHLAAQALRLMLSVAGGGA